MARRPPEDGFLGGGVRFGEALWCGPVERLQRKPPWHELKNFRVVSLGPLIKGRAPVLLVLGGCGSCGYSNGVWRSLDAGVTWEEVSPNDEGYIGNDGRVVHRKWCGRESFAAAGAWTEEAGCLKGLVYVVGGLGPSMPMGDVWASEDLGKTFLCTCPEAPFGRRVGSGLAVCPGIPERLVLAGGGWGESPERWDCWLSADGGTSWTEVETPLNSCQRRQPVLLLPGRGTLVVLGGRHGQHPCKDAYVAKLQWQRRTAIWQPMQVVLKHGKVEEPLDGLARDDCPWFLSHFTVYDHRTGEFLGLSGLSDKCQLSLGRLPKRLLMGPLERTPGKVGKLQVEVRSFPSRLPPEEELPLPTSAESHTRATPLSCELDFQNRMLFEFFVNPGKHAMMIDLKSRSLALESMHAVLAADSLRLFLASSNGVWSSCGHRRQVRMLERIGQQVHQRHGLVPEVWHRVLLALLGGRRCAPGGGSPPAGAAGEAPPDARAAAPQAVLPPGPRPSAADVVPLAEEELPPAALDEPETAFFIAGTWDNFKLNRMAWDGSALVYLVTVGPQGRESFQILQDGRWELALYPSVPDGNPHTKHVLMGPDSKGHGKNWTIGRHEGDKGPRGSCYRVALMLRRHSRRPGRVEWTNVGVGLEADYAKAQAMRLVQGIAKARAQRQGGEDGVSELGPKALPWNAPPGGGAQAAPGQGEPAAAPLDVDVREPLLLLGSCNGWNVDEAKASFRFKRFSGGASQAYQESRLIVRCLKETFEFQVLSAKRLWDWRIYPSGEKTELSRGVKDHVQADLYVGADHESLNGKNFRVRKKFDDKVYIMVSLSEDGVARVWCE